MAGPLTRRPLGPFSRGVIDRADASLGSAVAGVLKRARGVLYSGAGQLSARSGSRVVLTLQDDQGSPATVTSVIGVWQFADRALAMAHSTVTNKIYLYVLSSTLDGWYNSAGVLQATASPQPIASVWQSTATAPDVFLAEGLGVAYIAHAAAADKTSLAFSMRQYDPNAVATSITSITRVGATATVTTAAAHKLATGDKVTIAGAVQPEYNGTYSVTVTGDTTYTYTVSGTPATPATGTITQLAYITNVVSDLDVSGTAEPLYALGCIAFQQHLWIWGVGSGSTAANHFRPELARFSGPSFSLPFASSDSLTVGNRVRSDREKIVGAAVAGSALFLGSPFGLTRVTGYGRSSWFKQPLDNSFGFPGPKCMTTRKETLYYWSSRGPMRCTEGGSPEPLWTAIEAAVASIINPQKIVAAYDESGDVVIFSYDSGAGVRTIAIYDCTREVWLGPDDDIGLVVRAAGSVSPVYASTAATVTGPDAAPSAASTTSVGASVATANWTLGDVTAQTQVEYRRQGDTAWIVAGLVAASVTSYQITGLTAGVAYEWRAAHFEGGTYSSYLGPSVATQFTTSLVSSGLLPPTNLSLSVVSNNPGYSTIRATWTNSGESGVSTDVETRDATHAGIFSSTTGADAPTSSAEFDVYVSGNYEARAKHTKPAYADSDYTATANVDVNVDGLDVT
jgi:hypothetical protein